MSETRCVLAYSGGLDTSAMLPWLRERGYEVHAVLVDVGQEEDLPALCRKALRYGAASATVRDARPAMFEQVVPFAIGLAATYEGTYRLGTALARPFIAAEQVSLARELGGAMLVHGATGKGNDQVRFEFAYRSLAPRTPVLAPWKTWEFSGRVDLVHYLRSRGFDDDYVVQKDYSLDENLWHLSVEGGPLEDPATLVPVEDVLAAVAGRFACRGGAAGERGASPDVADAARGRFVAEAGETVDIEFSHGVPVALQGQRKPLSLIVSQLNRRHRHAAWAWDLVIENRFTGIKSRGLYINPAAKLLHVAADALARACLNKPAYDQYARFGREYGTMIYRGEYFSDQRVVLEAAATALLSRLNGSVTLRLSPTLYAARIAADHSMFTKALATFEESEFDHNDAAGFIRLSWLSNVGRPFVDDRQSAGIDGVGGHAEDKPVGAISSVG